MDVSHTATILILLLLAFVAGLAAGREQGRDQTDAKLRREIATLRGELAGVREELGIAHDMIAELDQQLCELGIVRRPPKS